MKLQVRASLATLAAVAVAGLGFGIAAAQTQPQTPASAPAAPAGQAPGDQPATTSGGVDTSVTVGPDGTRHELIANAPVRDTPENRAKYGQPMSRAGKKTAPAGN